MEETKEEPLLPKPDDKATAEAKKAFTEAVIEPSPDFLFQLQAMGFPQELCKKALVKVLNTSVAAAVDALMELSEKEGKTNPASSEPAGTTVQVVSYECTMCTFKNPDGKAVCEICGTAAPQTAYVFLKTEAQVKAEEEAAAKALLEAEEEKIKAENERI